MDGGSASSDPWSEKDVGERGVAEDPVAVGLIKIDQLLFRAATDEAGISFKEPGSSGS